jgi:hypothetical protein
VVQKPNLREAVRHRRAARVRFGAPVDADGCTPNALRQQVYTLGGEAFRV